MVNNRMLQLLRSSPGIRCVRSEMPPIRTARQLAVALQEPSEEAKATFVMPPVVSRRVRT
jgi:hypothetical protein